MEPDASIESNNQFWDEIEDVVSTPCYSHERIDDTLRTWLSLVSDYREKYLDSEHDLARCALKLLQSPLFERHTEYVRRQIVFALLQEDDPYLLHLIAAFLLFDGRQDGQCFEMLNAEGGFQRLVELIGQGVDDDLGLHHLLLEAMYEMSRIQRITADALMCVDDAFILYLFQIIEGVSNNVNDPYHYPVIRVLLVLNEQFMVSGHSSSSPSSPSTSGVTNRIIKMLSVHGAAHKTFGENIILLLNRESETSLQLLILKLLYLLFSIPSTQEYFYTNDLHVLVDILLRNLLDLPPQSFSPAAGPLRHTYLRVLHPLLAHTQLRHPPHYKRDELRKVLFMLASDGGHGHFDRPDDTTVRLVGRCVGVDWLKDDEDQLPPASSPPASAERSIEAGQAAVASSARQNRLLSVGMALPEAQGSTLSFVEMAEHTEKPGVITPSREKGDLWASVVPPAEDTSVASADVPSVSVTAPPPPPPPAVVGVQNGGAAKGGKPPPPPPRSRGLRRKSPQPGLER